MDANWTLGQTVTSIIEILILNFNLRHRQAEYGFVSIFSLVVILNFLKCNFGSISKGPTAQTVTSTRNCMYDQYKNI